MINGPLIVAIASAGFSALSAAIGAMMLHVLASLDSRVGRLEARLMEQTND